MTRLHTPAALLLRGPLPEEEMRMLGFGRRNRTTGTDPEAVEGDGVGASGVAGRDGVGTTGPASGDGVGTATAVRDEGAGTTTAARDHDVARGPRPGAGLADREVVARRQREEFGGINWGAVFFGWLVAVGMAAILIAILSAAGAALGLTKVTNNDVSKHAATIGIGGGIALLVILVLAYYSGGYVAGRMSRFDGGRQGFGVWIFGLLITVIFAVAGVAFGSKYNVLNSLNLPRIPIKEGTLATGGAIALAAILIGSLLAAVLGGVAGRRYHGKVDALAYEAEPRDRAVVA